MIKWESGRLPKRTFQLNKIKQSTDEKSTI